jgi:hypothetical protein
MDAVQPELVSLRAKRGAWRPVSAPFGPPAGAVAGRTVAGGAAMKMLCHIFAGF